MDAGRQQREEEKRRLLERLSQLLIEEEEEAGTFDSVPHFSRLEAASDKLSDALGRVSREAFSRRTLDASASQVACPECGRKCPTQLRRRKAESKAGLVEITEIVAHCPTCRRDFFPSS